MRVIPKGVCDTENVIDLTHECPQVSHEGQVIAAVVAETHAQAQRAAHCVKVTYEDLEPVVTIKDAIARKCFYPIDIKVRSIIFVDVKWKIELINIKPMNKIKPKCPSIV